MLDTPAVTPSPEKVSEDEPAKQGSIVDDSDDGFEFICDEEPHMIRGPLAPGYASLYLGQRFTDLDRGPGPFPVSHPAQGYEIVRKLGWGEQGSVWLARRLENACQPSFAAIKVLTSSVSKAIIYDESFEMRALLRTARRVMSDHPGRPYCTLLLDAFLYQTPDSLHFCFVFEPLSFSLHEYVEVERRERGKFGFSVDGLRNIARQVLRAVSYIHGNGYIHTDIKSDNIFIDVGVSNEAIAKYLAEHASRTYPARQEPRVSLDHIITVMSEPLPPFSLPDRNGLRLKLGDLGAAIPQKETDRFTTVMPTLLRAPEVLLGCPWGWQVDIWMVGCLIFDRIHTDGIFNMHGIPKDTTVEGWTGIHLARMQELLGPFPASFLDRCNKRDEYFDKSGELLCKLDSTVLPALGDLDQQLSPLRGQLPDDERAALLNFMRRCLMIDPQLRPSAEELLKDPFLEG